MVSSRGNPRRRTGWWPVAIVWAVIPCLLGAAGEAQPRSLPLDPETRARVMMSLLAIVILGIALVGFAMVFGHRVRRTARGGIAPSQHRADDWYKETTRPSRDATLSQDAALPDDPRNDDSRSEDRTDEG
jgi:hypothetical protein